VYSPNATRGRQRAHPVQSCVALQSGVTPDTGSWRVSLCEHVVGCPLLLERLSIHLPCRRIDVPLVSGHTDTLLGVELCTHANASTDLERGLANSEPQRDRGVELTFACLSLGDPIVWRAERDDATTNCPNDVAQIVAARSVAKFHSGTECVCLSRRVMR
jgi:hypothetical protein